MNAGPGERSFVHENRDGDFRGEAYEGLARCGQEEVGGTADSAAENDDVGGEGCGVLIEGQAEMAAEIFEGQAGATVGGVGIFGVERWRRDGGLAGGKLGAWVVAASGIGDG